MLIVFGATDIKVGVFILIGTESAVTSKLLLHAP